MEEALYEPFKGSVTVKENILLRIVMEGDLDTCRRARQGAGTQLEALPDAAVPELPTGGAQPTHKRLKSEASVMVFLATMDAVRLLIVARFSVAVRSRCDRAGVSSAGYTITDNHERAL